MNARILVTEPIINSVIDDLRADYTVDVGKRGKYTSEETLLEDIANYDALLPMLSTPVTKQVMEAAPSLKIVANHAVGYNNIDLDAAQDLGIHVANTPGVLTESCADFTMALLLSVTRKLKESEKYLREGNFDGWDPLGFLGMEMNGSTLGILGMGRIGTAVARRAKAFGLNIVYHNRSRVDANLEEELGATYISNLNDLATASDIVSIHCPLTDETHHAIDAAFINTMPEHGCIINTARGPIIDEAALADALHNKSIAGAGLDVFEEEPNVHSRLLNAPRCVLTPHIASATEKTREAIGMLAANAIRGVLEGEDPANIPNLLTD